MYISTFNLELEYSWLTHESSAVHFGDSDKFDTEFKMKSIHR